MLAAGRDGLWLVTRGAQPAAAAMDAADGACIAGLGPVAALAHSELRSRRPGLGPAAPDPRADLCRTVLPPARASDLACPYGPRLSCRPSPHTMRAVTPAPIGRGAY